MEPGRLLKNREFLHKVLKRFLEGPTAAIGHSKAAPNIRRTTETPSGQVTDDGCTNIEHFILQTPSEFFSKRLECVHGGITRKQRQCLFPFGQVGETDEIVPSLVHDTGNQLQELVLTAALHILILGLLP